MIPFADLYIHYLFKCQQQWKKEITAILPLIQYTKMYLVIYHDIYLFFGRSPVEFYLPFFRFPFFKYLFIKVCLSFSSGVNLHQSRSSGMPLTSRWTVKHFESILPCIVQTTMT